MVKHRLAGLCLLLASAFVPAQAAAPADLSQSLVRVRVVNESRRLANGSGVAVRGDMIVTSCHGTRGARWIDVLGAGQDWKIKRLVKDVEHDLCLLQLEHSAFEPFQLASAEDEPRLGDAVSAVGFVGLQPARVHGTVKALHMLDGAKVIQTDAAFKTGESGGALLDAAGKLVGILTFYADGDGGGFFALPVKWVQRLIERAQSGLEPDTQAEAAFWERQDAQRPWFLRALAREYAADWPALSAIAGQWSDAEPHNPEAWLALGKARYHTSDCTGAAVALREATRLEPRHSQGWYFLGRAYAALNERTAYAQALERLELLSPNMAAALREPPQASQRE